MDKECQRARERVCGARFLDQRTPTPVPRLQPEERHRSGRPACRCRRRHLVKRVPVTSNRCQLLSHLSAIARSHSHSGRRVGKLYESSCRAVEGINATLLDVVNPSVQIHASLFERKCHRRMGA